MIVGFDTELTEDTKVGERHYIEHRLT